MTHLEIQPEIKKNEPLPSESRIMELTSIVDKAIAEERFVQKISNILYLLVKQLY